MNGMNETCNETSELNVGRKADSKGKTCWSFGDAAKANDDGRHTRPLKAALGSRVPHSGTGDRRKERKKKKE